VRPPCLLFSHSDPHNAAPRSLRESPPRRLAAVPARPFPSAGRRHGLTRQCHRAGGRPGGGPSPARAGPVGETKNAASERSGASADCPLPFAPSSSPDSDGISGVSASMLISPRPSRPGLSWPRLHCGEQHRLRRRPVRPRDIRRPPHPRSRADPRRAAGLPRQRAPPPAPTAGGADATRGSTQTDEGAEEF